MQIYLLFAGQLDLLKLLLPSQSLDDVLLNVLTVCQYGTRIFVSSTIRDGLRGNCQGCSESLRNCMEMLLSF